MDNSLKEIKKNWKKETDNYLIKAATIDLNDYTPEIQEIIISEFKKRGLEGAEFDKPSIAKESAKGAMNMVNESLFVKSYHELFDGYVPKYPFISKVLLPLMIFFNSLCGVLGVLFADGLRKLLYKEVEVEEQVIYSKKK